MVVFGGGGVSYDTIFLSGARAPFGVYRFPKGMLCGMYRLNPSPFPVYQTLFVVRHFLSYDTFFVVRHFFCRTTLLSYDTFFAKGRLSGR